MESKGDGLPEYKSLICHSLQDKFRFEDILKGGQDLLIKDEFLGKVLNLATKEEIIEALKERYHEIVSKDAEAYAKVNKKKYKFTKIFCYTVSAIAVILLGFSIYYMFIEKPILKAKVAGEEYYIGSDYGSVIEAMDKVPISKLDLGQKYILAVSYIKSLSLTEQQKQVIIGKMPQNSDELLMEYWIYIGRRDAENAEDVAMREADNELLAYAYMMEYENLLIDTSISGAKKDERLTDLNTTINELTEPYLKMQEEDEAALEEEEEEDAQSILETRLDELEELVETQQKDIKEIKKEQKKTDTTETIQDLCRQMTQ